MNAWKPAISSSTSLTFDFLRYASIWSMVARLPGNVSSAASSRETNCGGMIAAADWISSSASRPPSMVSSAPVIRSGDRHAMLFRKSRVAPTKSSRATSGGLPAARSAMNAVHLAWSARSASFTSEIAASEVSRSRSRNSPDWKSRNASRTASAPWTVSTWW